MIRKVATSKHVQDQNDLTYISYVLGAWLPAWLKTASSELFSHGTTLVEYRARKEIPPRLKGAMHAHTCCATFLKV